jgi:hypothetical protein
MALLCSSESLTGCLGILMVFLRLLGEGDLLEGNDLGACWLISLTILIKLLNPFFTG